MLINQVFDLMQTTFKELMLSEIHSIPHGNQIVVSPSQFNQIFLIGGHFFKKASNKVFELDTSTSEFKEHDPMIQARWLHRTTAYKNFIFVSGGVVNDKEIAINSVISIFLYRIYFLNVYILNPYCIRIDN